MEFAIVATDRHGRITEWNPGAERILGWTAGEMLGQTAEAFFTPEDRANGRIDHEMTVSLRLGRGIDERWHLRKDGSRFWASGEMMPLKGETGEHVGFVKVLRDRTEQHLTGVRLHELETQLMKAQEAGGVGLCTLDIDTARLVTTPKFSEIYGLPHRDWRPAEDFARLVVPEDRHLASDEAGRRAGTSLPDVEYRIRRADTNELRWIARKGDYEFEGGRPVRFVGIARDITERKLAEEGLAASERKWRGLFEQLQEGFVVGRVIRDETGRITDWRYEEVNPASHDLVGLPPGSALGRRVREVFPGIEEDWIAQIADVVETGRSARFTGALRSLGRWYEGVAQPLGKDRFSLLFLEVTDRVEQDEMLRNSEARVRTVVDSMPAGVLLAEAPSGRLLMSNARLRELLGEDVLHAGSLADHAAFAGFQADGRPIAPVEHPLARIVSGERDMAELEMHHQRPDGRRVWIAIAGRAVKDEAGRTIAAVLVVTDIEQRKADEARQIVLNHELAHRLKNTLAVVQSIATQTLRTAADLASARAALGQRIQTLSKAHDILLAGQRDAGSVAAIIESAILLHDPDSRIELAGPPIEIGPKAALTLALVMHELSTNAAKYGALSVPEGRVRIAWSVDAAEASKSAILAIDWQESGGPPASPPTRRGFGTRLIEMGLSNAIDGGAKLDYAPAGLRCRFLAPLTELQADAQ